MYDLHAHILPGVDDGAKTFDDAVTMARVAADGGTRAILATPHRKDITELWSVQHAQEVLDDLTARAQAEGIELDLLLGMENHLDMELPDEVTSGRALPINGSRYILVELPFFGTPNYVDDVLFRLQLQGLTPVLAHPERIEVFQISPETLENCIRRGSLSQITAGSVLGHFGGKVQRFVRTLLRGGMVHVIASDTHFPEGPRSPELAPGMREAAAIVGQDRARAMVLDTPKAILENLQLSVEPPERVTERKRWWRFRRNPEV